MDDLICKYVIKNGKTIGESIDVFEGFLIVKVGGDFIAIPKDKIESVETEKIYVSDFDENTAKEIGKKWVVEKSKPMSLEEMEKMKYERV